MKAIGRIVTFIGNLVLIGVFCVAIIIGLGVLKGDMTLPFSFAREDAVPDNIRPVTAASDTGFHLCTSIEQIDKFLDTMIQQNYWIAFNSYDRLAASCPAYSFTNLRHVEIISEQAAPIPGYSNLVLFRISDESLGIRYSALMEKSRTGLAEGAIAAIFDHRTNSGITETLNQALSPN